MTSNTCTALHPVYFIHDVKIGDTVGRRGGGDGACVPSARFFYKSKHAPKVKSTNNKGKKESIINPGRVKEKN